jgi:hypothetical protein
MFKTPDGRGLALFAMTQVRLNQSLPLQGPSGRILGAR